MLGCIESHYENINAPIFDVVTINDEVYGMMLFENSTNRCTAVVIARKELEEKDSDQKWRKVSLGITCNNTSGVGDEDYNDHNTIHTKNMKHKKMDPK